LTLQIEIERNRLSIHGVNAFDLGNTLTCGQAFRWSRMGNAYHGVVKGTLLVAEWRDESLYVEDHSLRKLCPDGLASLVFDYFMLGDDHARRERLLCERDEIVAQAVRYAPGIRILRQDPWECLISFIISARNFIPSIMSTIMRLCERFGERVSSDEYEEVFGTRRYSFPSACAFCGGSIESIESCGASYRAKYIFSMAQLVSAGGADLDLISRQPYEEARESLMSLYGVGPKIAECVLLYSMGRYEAFPIDTWISRVIRFMYLDDPRASVRQMHEFARQRFGDLAGFAQQYLFHWARTAQGTYLRALEQNSR
jgi:N-glycosylase/DNA lyase